MGNNNAQRAINTAICHIYTVAKKAFDEGESRDSLKVSKVDEFKRPIRISVIKKLDSMGLITLVDNVKSRITREEFYLIEVHEDKLDSYMDTDPYLQRIKELSLDVAIISLGKTVGDFIIKARTMTGNPVLGYKEAGEFVKKAVEITKMGESK